MGSASGARALGLLGREEPPPRGTVEQRLGGPPRGPWRVPACSPPWAGDSDCLHPACRGGYPCVRAHTHILPSEGPRQSDQLPSVTRGPCVWQTQRAARPAGAPSGCWPQRQAPGWERACEGPAVDGGPGKDATQPTRTAHTRPEMGRVESSGVVGCGHPRPASDTAKEPSCRPTASGHPALMSVLATQLLTACAPVGPACCVPAPALSSAPRGDPVSQSGGRGPGQGH